MLPGMFVEAVISVKSRQSNLLPEDAILQSGNKKYVFVTVGPTMFKMVEVTTGLVSNGYVEILSGTDQFKNDSIVVGNAHKLFAISNMENE